LILEKETVILGGSKRKTNPDRVGSESGSNLGMGGGRKIGESAYSDRQTGKWGSLIEYL